MTTAAATDDPSARSSASCPQLGYTSDVTVTIQLDNVGGPSAGLMFALGIYDKLTPGAVDRRAAHRGHRHHGRRTAPSARSAGSSRR